MALKFTSESANEPLVTIDLVKAQFTLALNQSNFQKLQDEADKLVFNEDNVTTIAAFLTSFRKLTSVLNNKHEMVKKPFLTAGQLCDQAKRDMNTLLTGISDPIQTKYEKLCRDIAEQKRKADEEKQRIATIKQGIDSNMLSFSQKIANALTMQQVLDIERLINLEKGRKEKYQEFLEKAVTNFSKLTVNITDQKAKIRQLEELKKKEAEATAANDEEKMMALRESQETVKQQIEEKKEQVQLDAIDAVTNKTEVITAEAILPKVKVRYSSWKWEVRFSVIERYQKSLPSYLMVSPNEEVIEAKLKELKASKVLEDKEEYIWEGVRFWLDIKY